MNRRSLLAMVHIAKKDLGLDDDTYRDVLERVTGARSAKHLEERDLAKVITAFCVRGWTPRGSQREPFMRSLSRPSEKPYVRKIYALWSDMERRRIVAASPSGGLRAFVKRMTTIDDPEWLEPAQARVVIEALKAWRNRAEGDAAHGARDDEQG